MTRVLALVLALAALGFGVYLAILIGLIKRRGFGAGRRVDFPSASLSLRVPTWWVDEGGAPGEIRLRTGNHRGLVSIRPVEAWTSPGVGGGEAGTGLMTDRPRAARRPADASAATVAAAREGISDPADALRRLIESSVRSMDLALDVVEVEVGPLEPVQDEPGRAAGFPTGLWHARLASGGRSAADPETRTYYELHVIAGGGGAAALVYTNGILFGPLDAFYVDQVVRSARSLEEPSSS